MSRLVILFWIAPFVLSAEPIYEDYEALLEKYVAPDGVLYAEWHASTEDREVLKNVLREWAEVDPEELDRSEATAFLINLYNAAMIDIVLDEYPLDSVREIGFLPFAVFRRDSIALNGEEVSLDEIEKEMLLKDYFDPRIHFAVNCASVSCPPLRAEPFRGKDLDRQMEEQTRAFAESDHSAFPDRQKGTTYYSELFKWYAEDFPGDDPAEYLNRYRSQKLQVGNTVRWIDYDWALNEAKRKEN